MKYTYKTPREVCSDSIDLEIDDAGIITHAAINGGCSGNAQGIGKLVEGRPAREVMGMLRGIRCGRKRTSCPDQLAIAIGQALGEADEAAH